MFYLLQIVGVTWHPGMIGPLMTKEVNAKRLPLHFNAVECIEFLYRLSLHVLFQEDVEDYYRAYKCMATMVNTFPYQVV